ncbi:MAG: ABC transporter permease [Alphaproteobacteria bacterium]|nr:ABC transporter permease [Alphaproteobacteria bacterium]
MTAMLRVLVIGVGLIALWAVAVLIARPPPYIMPGPIEVAVALFEHAETISYNAAITLIEILLGLSLGIILGIASALVMAYFRPARRWLMPVLVISQALPVFALAPLLVLWLGYGLGSKVAMATLIIFFPVTATFFDGLRRTDQGWLDLARIMNGSRLAILRRVRIPAALPAFGAGLRVAAAVAPIGAVVGEWVGSSAGLGYLMLHANARLQIDLMFAALVVLGALAVTLYYVIDIAMNRLVYWQPETDVTEIG